MPTTLIPKQTAASTVTLEITRSSIPYTLQVDGDLAANTIVIWALGINGTDSTASTNTDGDPIALSTSNVWHTFYGPCKIKIVKGVTANAVGLMGVN